METLTLHGIDKKTARKILDIAERHQHEGHRASAASLCAAEALTSYLLEDYGKSCLRSLRSLRLSIGSQHRDYDEAVSAIYGLPNSLT